MMNNLYAKIFITGFAFAITFIIPGCYSNDGMKERDHQGKITGELQADLSYIEDFFDFGSIAQGEVVSHTFRFVNKGNDNLIIKDIIPDCGCTRSKIDKMNFKPNEEGRIEVIFDSKGWRGMQYKSVTIRSNAVIKEKSVTFKANVVAKN